MKQDFVFTSESVTEGHPDKLCDVVADAIVDRFLQRDPRSNVVAECAVAKGILFIAARYSSSAKVDLANVARETIARAGYHDGDFTADSCSVMTSVTERPAPPESALDDTRLEDADIDRVPARNQVNVFGYACRQTEALLPLPIWLAHKLSRRLTALMPQPATSFLRPDATTQVGVEFRKRRPYRIHSITLVVSHTERAPAAAQLKKALVESVVEPVFADEPIKPDANTRIFVNPDGPFLGGGPTVHSGLTGRKNAIDTYGEYARHSGSALSGKGPMRIDRTGAYAARHAAKNVVAAGLAEECEVQLSYSIGQCRPVSVQLDTYGTGRVADEALADAVEESFEFRPLGIVRNFRLRHLPSDVKGGFYTRLAAYGHVGRSDIGLPWEAVDAVAKLRRLSAR
jgi:S-adenosylmethionine synthetase